MKTQTSVPSSGWGRQHLRGDASSGKNVFLLKLLKKLFCTQHSSRSPLRLMVRSQAESTSLGFILNPRGLTARYSTRITHTLKSFNHNLPICIKCPLASRVNPSWIRLESKRVGNTLLNTHAHTHFEIFDWMFVGKPSQPLLDSSWIQEGWQHTIEHSRTHTFWNLRLNVRW